MTFDDFLPSPDGPLCPRCPGRIFGIEYIDGPAAYDGISEWRCQGTCGGRWGRWSGRELGPDELEGRWGRNVVKRQP